MDIWHALHNYKEQTEIFFVVFCGGDDESYQAYKNSWAAVLTKKCQRKLATGLIFHWHENSAEIVPLKGMVNCRVLLAWKWKPWKILLKLIQHFCEILHPRKFSGIQYCALVFRDGMCCSRHMISGDTQIYGCGKYKVILGPASGVCKNIKIVTCDVGIAEQHK